MISVAEALERVTNSLRPVASEVIPVQMGLGRVLAVDIESNLTYPPSDISAMDGYAVIASDTSDVPTTLHQVGIAQAGSGFAGTVKSGETVRIFTGAPMPHGSDAVVIQENTQRDGEMITISSGVAKDTFVRPQGMDIKEGQTLHKAGHRLSARDLGLIASANHANITVHKKPKIAYLATGDELVMPGESIGPDQIISSNSISIDASIRAFGGEPMSLGIARDNADSLRAALSRLQGADMLVTIGGASVGDYDLVQSVLGEKGLRLDFYKVAMRPGKPLIFGDFGGVPMLGLPGNPVSTSVTSLLFLKPAIDALSGMPRGEIAMTTATLGTDLPENDRRQDYIRATLSRNESGHLIAMPYGRQDSAMMSLLAGSDCLIVRPPHVPFSRQGSEVDVIQLRVATDTF